MLYNLSQFMTKLKQDIGIKDVPLPVSDQEIIERFQLSALKDFSVLHPWISEFVLTQDNIVNRDNLNLNGSVTYQIPKYVYEDTTIITILGVNTLMGGGFSDTYIPTGSFLAPDTAIMTIADVQLTAAMGTMTGHAPTHRFIQPNSLVVYNGWYGGSYRVEAAFEHSLSLSTIEPDCFLDLFKLAELDIKAFLFPKLKRKDNMDVGIGNTALKIDNWENAEDQYKDLLEKWNESANLDYDRISYW